MVNEGEVEGMGWTQWAKERLTNLLRLYVFALPQGKH